MTHYRWAEGWLAGYWVLTALILLFGPQADMVSMRQALAQLVAALVLYLVMGWTQRQQKMDWLGWILWVPAILWTYKSIDIVQKTLARPSFEVQVQGWEQALWKCSPALEWSQQWKVWLFSEVVHACYFAYYFIVPVLLIRLLRRQRDDLARIALAGALSTLLVSYFLSIVFPVQGPRPLLPALAQEVRGPFWALCHALAKEGAAAAAAFPSGHVSLSACVAMMAWRWDRSWRWLYLFWAAGIAAATVYGRFHYTVDVAAGLVVAAICAGMVLVRDPDA